MAEALQQTSLMRFIRHFEAMFPDLHMKDLAVDHIGPGREMVINNHRVINFGSDSFLGLDQDPRVLQALHKGIDRWGSHNGSSRAFTSVAANVEAEERIAAWLKTESALIYPSVTLTNAGAIPGLVTKHDAIFCDEFAHNSIQEATKIAKAGGTRVFTFRHNDVDHLTAQIQAARPYRHALITIDGVYSMSGELPPLREFHELSLRNQAILYVDDAHGTGVLGSHGRGTIYDALGTYENVLAIGSLSKAFSCFGGFIGCPNELHQLLKIRSNSYVFGGPVPPCYFDAILTVLDIFTSSEYDQLIQKLQNNLQHLVNGIRAIGLDVLGGLTPILSIPIGHEEDTLRAGAFLFEQGYYVQSVTFPAVPYHGGVLRIQANANHTEEQINGLLGTLALIAAQQPESSAA